MLTDPTYLRFIFDGLESKSFHRDIISELPNGLIGVYEEALPQAHNVQARERFISFFSAWALLKKEVSTNFVSDLLNWQEQELIDTLFTYTKWFNSPTSGTYILYHERLRAFLLSKITSEQLNQINRKIIIASQQALESKKGDEWEIYALEHFPSHLLIQAMQDKEYGVTFKKLVYDTSYWNRQMEVSKGYDWSKKMMNLALMWAAKQDTDELIECALNKIDLHYMEQNDAPRIVELVAQNDIETALERIESFGANDKEGLQRKFTIYMLCLMELTLLDSKDKPFRKTAIEKLLNHLDENIPIDHSLLDWNYFLPSYLIFNMAIICEKLGLNYLILYKRASAWDLDWIAEQGISNEMEIRLLLDCAQFIFEESSKSNVFAVISTELLKQGKEEEANLILQGAFSLANGITDSREKSRALCDISIQLAKQGKMEDALDCASKINTDSGFKNEALKCISIEFAKQGKIEVAFSCARLKNDDKSSSKGDTYIYGILIYIYIELVKQGNFDKAFYFIQNISDDYYKSIVLSAISTELVKMGKYDEGLSVFQDALAIALDISDYRKKNRAISEILTELARQGRIEKAFENLHLIVEDEPQYKDELLINIYKEQIKRGKYDEALFYFRNISNDFYREFVLRAFLKELEKIRKFDIISKLLIENLKFFPDKELYIYSHINSITNELVNKDKLNEAYACAQIMDTQRWKSEVLQTISCTLFKKGKFKEALAAMNDAIACVDKINDQSLKNIVLEPISIKMTEQGNIKEALIYAEQIKNTYWNGKVLKVISSKLASEGRIDDALVIARGIQNINFKSQALSEISTELIKQSKLRNGEVLLQEAKELAESKENSRKNEALSVISIELAKQRNLEGAQKIINDNESSHFKSKVYLEISKVFANYGKQSESLLFIEKAIHFAHSISDGQTKSESLKSISNVLVISDSWHLAEKLALEIQQIAEKHNCFKAFAKSVKDKDGCQISFLKQNMLQDNEARVYYLKGWAESITVDDNSHELAHKAIQALKDDSSSLEHFLQVYTLHELFFGSPSKEKIDRFNKTLNLQWALDIIAQFPQE